MIDEAKLSQEEKMDMWHSGERKQNIKACSDDKIKDNYRICRKKGYKKEAGLLKAEAEARGISLGKKSLRDFVRESVSFGGGTSAVITNDRTGTDNTQKDAGKTSNIDRAQNKPVQTAKVTDLSDDELRKHYAEIKSAQQDDDKQRQDRVKEIEDEARKRNVKLD